MTKNSRPATIYDVAERAGVSHITVSRVVNNKQNVSPETRQRVQEAMAELGYTPNPIAQSLQARRTRTIELITTNIYGSDAAAIAGISAIAGDRGFPIAIIPVTVDELPAVLKAIPNRMVAGSILYAQDVTLDYGIVARASKRYPLVQMGGKVSSGVPSIIFDQGTASENAVQHLIDLGHKRIAFIGGQQRLLDGQVRYQAYLNALTRSRLLTGPVAIGDFGAASGAAAMQRILDGGEPFTAVFASSDAMALSAIHVLSQAGKSVPEDVSVIGYNDFDTAPFTAPPLTTVTNDLRQLGEITTAYLFEFIDNPEAQRHQRIFTPDLIIRASTAPPPKVQR